MSDGEIADCPATPCDKVEEAHEVIRRLNERVRELERQNLLQGEEIRIFKLRRYGQSSEKLTREDERQGLLFDEAELQSLSESDTSQTEEVRITKTVYTRRKRGRRPISPKLARIEVLVDLSEDEKQVGKVASSCGSVRRAPSRSTRCRRNTS